MKTGFTNLKNWKEVKKEAIENEGLYFRSFHPCTRCKSNALESGPDFPYCYSCMTELYGKNTIETFWKGYRYGKYK